jgi:hypothetical protein
MSSGKPTGNFTLFRPRLAKATRDRREEHGNGGRSEKDFFLKSFFLPFFFLQASFFSSLFFLFFFLRIMMILLLAALFALTMGQCDSNKVNTCSTNYVQDATNLG